ncbi:MAG: aspartate aminotransferase family protein [Oscillospiraceae bacterium]|nr:aspartate aminotransferase family protein [Oscillospiraceae bacterium]
MNTIEISEKYLMKTYGRQPMAAASGQNCVCTDEDGKQYIDFGSGIGTNSLGYCNDAWADAVCKQVRKIQHTSNYYYTDVQAAFVQKLCGITGYQKAFLGNSGAEANECAIKLARKYSFDKYGEGRGTIITLKNSFHGRTMMTLTATGQDVFHNYFFPFPTGFAYAEANNLDDLKSKLDGTVCAVMMEMIQGEGGVCAMEKEFVQAAAKLCEENDILFIVDEVQTGVGRTGTFLASEQFGVHPNVTTLAKGLGGGLPIGCCLADEKCAEVMGPSSHGSTFGGNPVVCAGALAVLEQVSAEGFLEKVQQKAAYIREAVAKCSDVAAVTGLGLMIGIALKTKDAHDVMDKARENGLLILTAKEKVRLLPPLTISQEEIEKGLKILLPLLEN